MKIDNNSSSYIKPPASETAARTTAAKTSEMPSPGQGVSVSLGSSSQLRSVESSMANTPTVDAKKVAEIKLAISEGRFQVNTAAIADRLINDVQELISAEER